jgi:hypothetical protein
MRGSTILVPLLLLTSPSCLLRLRRQYTVEPCGPHEIGLCRWSLPLWHSATRCSATAFSSSRGSPLLPHHIPSMHIHCTSARHVHDRGSARTRWTPVTIAGAAHVGTPSAPLRYLSGPRGPWSTSPPACRNAGCCNQCGHNQVQEQVGSELPEARRSNVALLPPASCSTKYPNAKVHNIFQEL